MSNTDVSDQSSKVASAASALLRLLAQLDRPDLKDRATAAAARSSRPGSVVTVVGEFKQGKSSLVNGILGSNVCPVDDDLATSAITLVSYGEQPAAMVRHSENGEKKSTRVELDHLVDWVSEAGNPDNAKQVERVEIKVPSALLNSGLMIVDTPGMGGLGSGHAAATLAFLPFADGLILVSDASAELSKPEIDFLAKAIELCPTVMFVQTKIDLYAEWERIFEINRGHLASRGIHIPMVAVSSVLRSNALSRGDNDLNALSNFSELIQTLGSKVVAPAKQTAAERSATDLRGVVAMLRSGLLSEKQILDDPTKLTEAVAELEKAKERLEYLRGPAARWSTVVADSIGDLSTTATHEFRAKVRVTQRAMDERVEELKTTDDWDEIVRDLQTEVAEAATTLFVRISDGRADVYEEVAELLRDEQLGLSTDSGGAYGFVDTTELWQGKANLDGTDSKTGRGARSILGLTQSAVSGSMMGGALARLTQIGALASAPFTGGAILVLGGLKLLDDRKRQLATRRQTARQQVRQFLDDVQFDVVNEASTLIRSTQRDLRDEFSDRLKELQRTYTETAQRAQTSAQATQAESKARLAVVEQSLNELNAISGQL